MGLIVISSGTASTLRTTISVTGKCVDCAVENPFQVFIFQKYARFMFVPFFPKGKEAFVRCEVCKRKTREYGMESAMLEQVRSLKRKVGTSLWLFTGFPACALLICGIFLFVHHSRRQTIDAIMNPQAGDLYSINLEDSEYYTVYRVQSVSGDTVSLQLNEKEAKGGSIDVFKSLEDEPFSDISVPVLLPEILKMAKSGEIMDIRKGASDHKKPN